ncbi:MAG: GAF domain-containing protein, partial [Cyanobacteria bacterium J06632_3]
GETDTGETQTRVVLELEPAEAVSNAVLLARQDAIAQAITRLQQIKDINAFCQAAVEEIQALTGYDRVMMYQFDEAEAGAVIAEVKQPEQVSYLGLHYPATDIPAIVRAFYRAGMIRLVPNLNALPAKIVTALSQREAGETGHTEVIHPIDLSQAILRSVDLCCVESHNNMGAAGFLVLSLVKEDRLWGLISCHHQSVKPLPYSLRSGCEILSRFISSQLASKVNEDEIEYLTQLKALQSNFIASISNAEDFKQALIHPQPRLLELVNAEGAAVCLDQDLTLIGKTPSKEAVQALIDWATQDIESDLFQTDCLSSLYPEAIAYKSVASGVIILKISVLRRYFILWFRPEVLQTVSWAGDPKESLKITEDGRVMLCPRFSFVQWKETVEATAQPWKTAEIESAADLKASIVGIVLNKADELAQINSDLARSNRELDSFAYAASHDLKEPLRGITNFSNILLRRHSESLDPKGIERLETLVRLAQRMDALIDALLRFSRLGQTELNYQPIDLNVLVERVIDDLQAGREGQTNTPQIEVVRSLPTISCDPILLREVFTNLIGNALKYTDNAEP